MHQFLSLIHEVTRKRKIRCIISIFWLFINCLWTKRNSFYLKLKTKAPPPPLLLIVIFLSCDANSPSKPCPRLQLITGQDISKHITVIAYKTSTTTSTSQILLWCFVTRLFRLEHLLSLPQERIPSGTLRTSRVVYVNIQRAATSTRPCHLLYSFRLVEVFRSTRTPLPFKCELMIA